MFKKFIATNIFLMLSLTGQAWAETQLCPIFLGGKLSATNNHPLLPQTILKSRSSDDNPKVRYLNSEQVASLEFTGDAQGRLIYRQSGLSPQLRADQYIVGVWDLDGEDGVGEVYGIPESDKASEYVKHSSFNNNQPVLAAFRLKTNEDGYITNIKDHSGHYRPTPLNIYFLIKKLAQEGIRTDSIIISFDNVVKELNRMEISASAFMSMMDRFSESEMLKFNDLSENRSNRDQFIEMLYLNTDIPLTIALLEIHYMRQSMDPEFDRLDAIIDMVDSGELQDRHFFSVVRNIFGFKYREIQYMAAIDRFGSKQLKAQYYIKILNYLLSRGRIKNQTFKDKIYEWQQYTSLNLR